MSEKTTDSGDHGHDEHAGVGHVVPVWILAGTLLALLFLTVVTVVVAQINLDFLNIWIALGIATVKATLVCTFFMHLRWDKPFNAILFVGALILLALFLGLSMMDTREYDTHIIDDWVNERAPLEQYLDKVHDKSN